MSLENPPIFEHGFVAGRFVKVVADTAQDPDRYADLRAIEGRVRFIPRQTVYLMHGEHPATVVKQSFTAQIDDQGYVADEESLARIEEEETDPDDDPEEWKVGMYLPVGLYRVETNFDNVNSVMRFDIEVKATHTKKEPLDLTKAQPLEIPPGFTEVTRIVDRERAEEAAEAAEGHAALALVYRDEAAQSATTAETHSTDAEGHADRAEEALSELERRVIVSDTEPENPQEGDIWLDTSVISA